MKILLTGATGLIGKELGKLLVRSGHEVYSVSRSAEKARLELPFPTEIIEVDLNQGPIPAEKIQSIEAVIHLAGENVGDGRWSEERKSRILSSRVQATQNLIQNLPKNLKIFISSSAVGYYGSRGDEVLTESSSQGQGFLAEVCEQWEKASQAVVEKCPQARTVVFRTGVVLSPFGGALSKMLFPFQMGVGGVLGSGKQWVSWIHLQDLILLFHQALENEKWSGIYNAVAPDPVTNRMLTEKLTETLGVMQGPPVPALALKALLGEMSQVVLDSQRVQSERIPEFEFLYPDFPSAIAHCAQLYREGAQVFHAEQFFPLPREKVFSFFSKAENLEAITPETLSFQVEKVSTSSIERGTLIDYRLKIHGTPVKWRTLIEDWVPSQRFVDVQLKGPYQLWHHTHSFEDLAGGTLMTDTVRYKLPLGKLGRLFAGQLVRNDVKNIFNFRQKTVPKLLGR